MTCGKNKEVLTIKDEKERYALYVSEETMQLAEDNYRSDCCRSRSEFIEKAILFYIGYLHARRAEYYLPRVLGSTLQGTLGMFADRIGRLMFKQAVEENIGNHILAADTDMDVETYEKLRSRSIREVKETHGEISFKDDLIFQKSL